MAAAKRTRTRKGSSSPKRSSGSRKAASRSRKRGSGKRKMLNARNATFYAKRTGDGRFKELDEKGRSLKGDRRVRAKTRTKSGYGDRGDRAA